MNGQLDLWQEFKRLGGFPKEKSEATRKIKSFQRESAAFEYFDLITISGTWEMTLGMN